MVFIRTDREDRTYIHPTYTLPMAAVLCPLPLRESTRMAAHNRLMEREWGFGCLIFILAEKSWDAQWCRSLRRKCHHEYETSFGYTVSSRPACAAEWDHGPPKQKQKEISWERLGSPEKCPISAGDSRCRQILFLVRWDHLTFPWATWKLLQFGEKLTWIWKF